MSSPPLHHKMWSVLRPQLWLVLAVVSAVIGERLHQPYLNLVSPALLLIYLHSQPLWRGVLLAAMAQIIAWSIFMKDFAPFMDQITWVITVSIGVGMALVPYLLDRTLASRLTPLLGSLLFPSAVIAMDTVRHFTDPTGSYGMLGYSFGAEQTLSHAAFYLGLDGLSFVAAWGAVVVARAYHELRVANRAETSALRPMLFSFSTTLALFWLLGLLAQWPSVTPESNVRVTTISQNSAFAGFHHAGKNQQKNLQDWLALSQQQVAKGAQIIVWGEGALMIESEFETEALEAAKAFAKSNNVHLVISIFHADLAFQGMRHNKLIWIDSAGLLRQVYHKNHGQFAEKTVHGDGALGFVDTEWGRFALSICWDADFPRFIAQAYENGAVALLNPSYDYEAVVEGRADIARLRAIENHVALIRPNNNGINLITDRRGKLLALQQTTHSNPVILSVDLPLSKASTKPIFLAQAFTFFCLALLTLLTAMAVRNRRKKRISDHRSTKPISR